MTEALPKNNYGKCLDLILNEVPTPLQPTAFADMWVKYCSIIPPYDAIMELFLYPEAREKRINEYWGKVYEQLKVYSSSEVVQNSSTK